METNESNTGTLNHSSPTLLHMASSTTMEAAALHILQDELPDPNQEISVQIDDTLTLKEFTIFSDLPLELRLQIWRAAFPRGRQVDIEDLIYDLDMKHPRRPFMPVTLHVNHESRAETNLHYFVIYAPYQSYGTRRNGTLKKPWCFHPRLDTLYQECDYDILPTVEPLITYLARIPGSSQKIQAIDTFNIRKFHVCSTDCYALKDGILYHGRGNYRDGPTLDLEIFQSLPGLKKLTFSTARFCDSKWAYLPWGPNPDTVLSDRSLADQISAVFKGWSSEYFGGREVIVEFVNKRP